MLPEPLIKAHVCAMLDQLTDRCGTMGLLVTLSYFYPSYMFWFQLSMAIDVACHWLYMQT
ncbi:hypothetical protein DOY81_007785 [Sarcophaga bullata]|nr:hypothetical protein DOY81_007785 [Sarcophaga bullata]